MRSKSVLKVFALILAVCFTFSLFMTGCGSDSTKTEASTKAAESTAKAEVKKEPVTLSVVLLQAWASDGVKEIFKKYEESSGNKIDMQLLPDDKGNELIKTRFATGELPDVQVMMAGLENWPWIKADTNLEDLSSESWVSNISPAAIDMITDNGKIYALPLWGIDVWGMVYNKEIYKNCGLEAPTSKEEMLKAFDVLKSKGYTPFYLPSKDLWPLAGPAMGASMLNYPAGDKVYSDLNTNKIKFAQIPSFTKAMDDLRDFNVKGYLGKTTMSDTWDGQFEAIAKDKAATALAYTGWLSEVEAKFAGTKDKLGFYPIYIGENKAYENGGNGGWFVPKGKRSSTAKELLTFVSQPEIGSLYFKSIKNPPGLKNINVDLEVSQKAVFEDINSGKIPANSGFSSWVQAYDFNALSKLVQEVLVGGKTGEAAAKELDTGREKLAKSLKLEGF